ncbi:protein TolR [Candidatus Coxiella mudrowiae]|uniref:Tol-Pal system protein TolR n=1 Tax=Candidatus Coxiella mudrowiae TaxID=2054173 RepID=A0ABM5UTJ7_9COXI|nr:protein TolR [Candidatus Coxiella mudrowiae]AKQ33274.1 TolR [Candidatus Coxiella mudrowiae]
MRKRALAEINVVPYIDVMLVLLVIFMITAPLLTQGVNVKLPQAAAKTLSPQQEAPIIVSIDSHGSYFLNIAKKPSQPITTQDLVTRVAAALQLANQNHQKQEIYVKGDKEVDYGKVVQMMVLLKYAGANSVELMTQNPPS